MMGDFCEWTPQLDPIVEPQLPSRLFILAMAVDLMFGKCSESETKSPWKGQTESSSLGADTAGLEAFLKTLPSLMWILLKAVFLSGKLQSGPMESGFSSPIPESIWRDVTTAQKAQPFTTLSSCMKITLRTHGSNGIWHDPFLTLNLSTFIWALLMNHFM